MTPDGNLNLYKQMKSTGNCKYMGKCVFFLITLKYNFLSGAKITMSYGAFR